MRETVEEVEDEGEIEPTPIYVVHAEFQINEGNDGSDVPAQNAPCCLNLSEGEYDAMTVENLPKTWHKHLDKAAQILTCHLPPSLDFFPKALLLGMVINTPRLTQAESITSDGWRRFEPNGLDCTISGRVRHDSRSHCLS